MHIVDMQISKYASSKCMPKNNNNLLKVQVMIKIYFNNNTMIKMK